MKAMGAISSILVVLTGIYLTWYWYVAITQRENPGGLVNVVGRWQTNLAETIADIGSLRLFALFTGVIVVSLMVSRRRRKQNELA